MCSSDLKDCGAKDSKDSVVAAKDGSVSPCAPASTASWLAFIIACAAVGACAAAAWDHPHVRALARRVATSTPMLTVSGADLGVPSVRGTAQVPDLAALVRAVAAYFNDEQSIADFVFTLSSVSIPAVLLVLVSLVVNRATVAATRRGATVSKTPAPLFLLRVSAPVDQEGNPLFEPIDPVPGLITAEAQAELRERQLAALNNDTNNTAQGTLEGGNSVGEAGLSLERPPAVSGMAPIITKAPSVGAGPHGHGNGNSNSNVAGCCGSLPHSNSNPRGSGSMPGVERRMSSLLGTSMAPAFEVPTAAEYGRLDEPRLMVAQILHGIRMSSQKAQVRSSGISPLYLTV